MCIALVSSNRSVIRINPCSRARGPSCRRSRLRGPSPLRYPSPIPLAEGTLGAVGKLWGSPESAGSRSGPLATSPRTSPNWFADRIDCGSYRPAALSRFVHSSSGDLSPELPAFTRKQQPGCCGRRRLPRHALTRTPAAVRRGSAHLLVGHLRPTSGARAALRLARGPRWLVARAWRRPIKGVSSVSGPASSSTEVRKGGAGQSPDRP